MMIAGICGGLDPEVPVGTVVNPEWLVDHSSGRAWRNSPPTGEAVAGKLMTTEQVNLDPALCEGFLNDGCIAVDMESAAVAEVCDELGCEWSVYRCIGDRPVDGLLDERVVAATNPDGSPDMDKILELLAEPGMAERLAQLGNDAAKAARLAAEAALRGCLALDG
jgi:adenosylhomocysteine nucleosidase